MTVESFGKDKNTQEDIVICTWFEKSRLQSGNDPEIAAAETD